MWEGRPAAWLGLCGDQAPWTQKEDGDILLPSRMQPGLESGPLANGAKLYLQAKPASKAFHPMAQQAPPTQPSMPSSGRRALPSGPNVAPISWTVSFFRPQFLLWSHEGLDSTARVMFQESGPSWERVWVHWEWDGDRAHCY